MLFIEALKVLLFKLLKVITSSVDKFIILGDFNYCNINWDTCSSGGSISGNTQGHKFLSAVNENFLIQHVLFPTRMRGSQTPHILDLVFTVDDFIENITDLSPLGKSDHCVLNIQCNLIFALKDSCTLLYSVKYNYNKCNFADLSKYISNALVNSTSLSCPDIDSEWVNLKQVVTEGVKKFVPCYSNASWKKKSSWKYPIKSNVIKLIKNKHRLWKRYLATRDQALLNDYKTIRNLVRKESRSTVQSIQHKVADSCKKNPKSFWNFIRSKTSSHSVIGDVKIINSDNTSLIIKEDIEKAKAFADHFSKMYLIENNLNFTELPSLLPPNFMPEVVFTEVRS